MLSIFDVIGPVMIGPSSSHTAGAARLARVARALTGNHPFTHVSFGLHGSFHDTYLGHGTDKALLAGALGIREDDEAIRDAPALAQEARVTYDYYRAALEDVHENSVQITFHLEGGPQFTVVGSSVGGGQIVIRRVGALETEFTANLPTLLVQHLDRRGMISDISSLITGAGINIAVMRYSRKGKGGLACCIAEVDEPIPAIVVETIAGLPDVYSAQTVDLAH